MLKFAGKTLIDLLKFRAEQQPDEVAYIFLVDGEDEEISMTYSALDQKAQAIAAYLQENFRVGDRVLLIYQPGLEFISGFFGCLYAGMIAVPVYPPIKKSEIERLIKILKNSQAKIALLDPIVHAGIKFHQGENREIQKEFVGLQFIVTEEISLKQAEKWREPNLTEESIAFLQYTSGSTGDPKGVIVNHENLLNNQKSIQAGFKHDENTIFVGWLPVYHDMGLIGNVLQPMYLGILCVLFSPAMFLQKPYRWLKAISKYKATTSGAPNFAFELCNKKITLEELKSLDLSSWKVAYNGSEPIRSQTLDRFLKKFKDAKLNSKAIYPCYGLAEATLFVTGDNPNQVFHTTEVNIEGLISSGGQYKQELVSCGKAYHDTQVVIVDPETMVARLENQIGEIWIKGKSVAKGYWNQPLLSDEIFHAYTKDSMEGPFLRSGDLGFIREGELYVTGRLKDLIIIHGVNHYPQDIELTVANCHPEIRPGCIAAFSVEKDGQEKLIVIAELKSDQLDKEAIKTVYQIIQQATFKSHKISIHDICFIKPKTIPKTSSGKIQRRLCKEKYLANTFLGISRLKNRENITKVELQVSGSSIKNKKDQKSGVYYGIQDEAFLEAQKNESKKKTDELLHWLRTYAKSRINSRLIDERRTIPPYIILDLGNQGILGCQVPEKYGGLGLTHTDTMRMVEQIVAIDTTIASFVGINNFLGVRPILRHAQEETKSKWLPELAKGRQLAGLAVTEEGAGSNIQKIHTMAIQQSNGSWLLNGKKIWIGSGSWAGVLNIFAKNQADHRMMAFAVEQGTPGLTQGPEAMTMGMRGMVQNSILMNNALVEDKNALGNGINGIDVLHDSLSYTRLALGASAVGGIKRCMQLMYEYASKRTISTGILLENPVTLERMNELDLSATALEALVYSITEKLDEGFSIPIGILSICKVIGPESFYRATDHLMQLLGGRGYIETSEVPQIFRDTRLMRIFEGPTEALTMFLGALKQAEDEIFKDFLIKHYEAPDLAACLKNDSDHVYSFWEDNATVFGGQADHEHTAKMHIGNLVCYTFLQAASNYFYQKTGSIEYRSASLWAKAKYDCILLDALKLQTVHQLWRNTEDIAFRVNTYSDSIGKIEKNMFGEDHNPDVVSHNKIVRELDQEVDNRVTRIGSNDIDKTIVQQIEQDIIRIIAEITQIEIKNINTQKKLSAYGIDSINSIEIIARISEKENMELNPDLLWEFDTIGDLANYIADYRVCNAVVKDESELKNSAKQNRNAVINVGDEFSLSEGQKGLWFLHKLEPKSSAYNVISSFKVKEKIDHKVLKKSLSFILRDRPILRTVYKDGLNGPVQQLINEKLSFEYNSIDVSDYDNTGIYSKIVEDSKSPFILSKGPLLRMNVYSNRFLDEHIIMLVAHHIICDADSMKIILKDLFFHYFSFNHNKPIKNKKTDSEYFEFIRYQNSMLNSEKGTKLQKYWREKTKDKINRLFCKKKKSIVGFDKVEFVNKRIELDESVCHKVKRFSAKYGVKESVIMMSSLAVLLYKYGGGQNISIDLAVSNRSSIDKYKESIGYYVNLLPILYSVHPNTRVIDFFKQARKVVFETLKHREYPYSEIAKNIAMDSEDHHSLSGIVFNYLDMNDNVLDYISDTYKMKVERYDIPQMTGQVDMSLEVIDYGDMFHVNISRSTNILDNIDIDNIIESYINILVNILEYPFSDIKDIDALTDNQKSLILRLSQGKVRKEFCNHTIDKVFEKQVEKCPKKIAVRYRTEAITYGDLNSLANQFAHYLRDEIKIKTGDIICILVQRTERWIIAMLGILKSGCVYLPIDPETSLVRIRYILENTDIKHLIHDQIELNVQKAFKDVPHINLNQVIEQSKNHPTSNISGSLLPDSVAYIIYTSGTTGYPKGVVVKHNGFINMVFSLIRELSVTVNDNVLQFASCSFDASLSELFPALLSGSTIHIIPEKEKYDMSNFVEFIELNQISLVQLTPSYLKDIPITVLPKIQKILCVGEKLNYDLGQKVSKYTTLFNGYGLTEASVGSTIYQVKESLVYAESIPIGRPINNVKTYILDEFMKLVPISVIGEMWIGGIGLAKGYLNNEKLTKEKFKKSPFSDDELIYKTGDYGRWMPTGDIEYINRIDNQLKIRGYRIEPEEIRFHLNKHKNVRDSLIIGKEIQGVSQLVAYVCPQSHECNFNELGSYLSKNLPLYMVPSIWVTVEKFPMTINGKVDLSKLPDPDHRLVNHNQLKKPKNEIENNIYLIWKKILEIDEISVDANLFHIGGHSLNAVKIVSEINNEYGYSLSIKGLFSNPTIEKLADHILETKGGSIKYEKQINLSELDIDIDIDDMSILNNKLPAKPTNIFLTGATGFLGGYVLLKLLEETDANIYCLTRSNSDEEGRSRIINNLKAYGLYKNKFKERINVVLGDLSCENLKINEYIYDMLANKVSHIYHVAAKMDHHSSYEYLEKPNVGSAKEVIKLATTHKLKKIIYVSTIGVFSPKCESLRYEVDCIDNELHDYSSGYSGSKWVAEKVIKNAMDIGVPTQIYRIGLVTGDKQSGKMPNSQWLTKLLVSCHEMGMYFDELKMPFTPVDYVADSLVQLSLDENLDNNVFHLINSNSDSLNAIFENNDKKYKKVSLIEWLNEAKKFSASQLLPIVSFIDFDSQEISELLKTKQDLPKNWIVPKVNSDKTSTILSDKAGILFPEMNLYYQKYLARIMADSDIDKVDRCLT